MAPDLTNNPHAEARWTHVYSYIYPDLDRAELRECWLEFCRIVEKNPFQAAELEYQIRADARVWLDS